LRARGLSGVQLCVSDAHEGLKNAIAKMLSCPWQRCTVHFLRDMLGHCGKARQLLVATAIRQIFAGEDAVEARERLAGVATALEQGAPNAACVLADAEGDVVGIYPNNAALVRLAGVLPERCSSKRTTNDSSVGVTSPRSRSRRPKGLGGISQMPATCRPSTSRQTKWMKGPENGPRTSLQTAASQLGSLGPRHNSIPSNPPAANPRASCVILFRHPPGNMASGVG
jgi:Transposase, Mutator family